MGSIAAIVIVTALVTSAAPPDLTGHWRMTLDPGFSGETTTMECDATQDGAALTLECDDTPASAGKIDDHAVSFVIMTGPDNLLPAKFAGTLDAGERVIAGTWRLEDVTGNRIGRFRAERR